MMDPITKARQWSAFLADIREFFEERDFLEVHTPCVVPAGAFESSIDTLKVSYAKGQAELHTSPEMAMKELLAQMKVPIFQIAKCFRDDPTTGIHLREFTMLEFYRPNCDYRTTMTDIQQLFEKLAGRSLGFEVLTMRELVSRATGVDIAVASTAEKLRKAIGDKIHLSADDSWDDMFFKLMVEKVEPWLPPERPILVKDYPASQCALGKISRQHGWTERFEVYWKEMELCNGCTELDDLAELDKRIEKERSMREAEGKPAHPFPHVLREAMSRDFPPSSGVAVGLDRLFWAIHPHFKPADLKPA